MSNGVRLAMSTLGVVLILALGAPLLAPFDPAAQLDVVALKNSAPSASHWLGTDPYSRDLLSRALFGARTTLLVAGIATCVALVLGVLWAGAAALSGRQGEAILMSFADVIRSLPRLLLLLAGIAIAGTLSPLSLACVVGAVASPHVARFTQMQIRQVLSKTFVGAAAALGVSRARVLLRHAAPHIVGSLTAVGVLLFAEVMAAESAMSFLGLGVRSPAVSWGSMVQDAVPYLGSAWWVAAIPCTCLLVTVLSATTIADHFDLVRGGRSE